MDAGVELSARDAYSLAFSRLGVMTRAPEHCRVVFKGETSASDSDTDVSDTVMSDMLHVPTEVMQQINAADVHGNASDEDSDVQCSRAAFRLQRLESVRHRKRIESRRRRQGCWFRFKAALRCRSRFVFSVSQLLLNLFEMVGTLPTLSQVAFRDSTSAGQFDQPLLKDFVVRHKASQKFYLLRVFSKVQLVRAIRVRQLALDTKRQRESELGGAPCAQKLVLCCKDEQSVLCLYDSVPSTVLEALLREQQDSVIGNEKALRSVAVQLLLFLEEVHERGFLHRSLRPRNVGVTPTGRLSVTDFSLVTPLSHSNNLVKNRGVFGDSNFLPPEVLQGEDYGPAADYWQLGVTLYWLLVGKRPWRVQSLNSRTRGEWTRDMEYCEPEAGMSFSTSRKGRSAQYMDVWAHVDDQRKVALDLPSAIVSMPIDFPSSISDDAQELLCGLLQRDPRRRLNAAQCRSLSFFDEVEWNTSTLVTDLPLPRLKITRHTTTTVRTVPTNIINTRPRAASVLELETRPPSTGSGTITFRQEKSGPSETWHLTTPFVATLSALLRRKHRRAFDLLFPEFVSAELVRARFQNELTDHFTMLDVIPLMEPTRVPVEKVKPVRTPTQLESSSSDEGHYSATTPLRSANKPKVHSDDDEDIRALAKFPHSVMFEWAGGGSSDGNDSDTSLATRRRRSRRRRTLRHKRKHMRRQAQRQAQRRSPQRIKAPTALQQRQRQHRRLKQRQRLSASGTISDRDPEDEIEAGNDADDEIELQGY
ncbi:MAG: hypothetical protein MHM6MM_004913 [Cercozoa sp. M6MM]